MDNPPSRLLLRELPLAHRLVIAIFLVSVAGGYGSALVQLHFQTAPPGKLLPGSAELERTYFGSRDQPMSQIERLLEATEGPLNGSGTMRPAFTEQSRDWQKLIQTATPQQRNQLLAEREGERRAVLSWLRAGAAKDEYDKDDHELGPDFASRELTDEFLVKKPDGKPTMPRRVSIRTLITRRCVDCHSAGGRVDLARLVPLDTYERLAPHAQVKMAQNMSLSKLAQTTHVHLLSFAVLYSLTGLIFCCTSYPARVRILLGPFTLVAQLVDIACWWLGRLEPIFAQGILVTGALVAMGLMIQILGSLWDLFGTVGRRILLLLLLIACLAAAAAFLGIIQPYLMHEGTRATSKS